MQSTTQQWRWRNNIWQFIALVLVRITHVFKLVTMSEFLAHSSFKGFQLVALRIYCYIYKVIMLLPLGRYL